MSEFLGFGLSGYRSFSGDVQRIAPFGKLTLLAGPNNSGKSNVLNFVHDQLPLLVEKLQGRQAFGVQGLDLPQGATATGLVYAVPMLTDDDRLLAFAKLLLQGKGPTYSPEKLVGFLRKLLATNLFPVVNGIAWFDIPASRGGAHLTPADSSLEKLRIGAESRNGQTAFGPTSQEWNEVWHVLTGQGGGGLQQHWIPETLNVFTRALLVKPKVSKVPAFRQITAGSADAYELGGSGLYAMLAKLERPAITALQDKQKFESIVEFVRRVTRVSDAMLEVPYERNTLHVRLDGRDLPISHLGTGIHQVILLAAAATLHEDTLMCLEEPELHLHPLLQRELLRYLDKHTTNQYLISTHSAHFLDTEGAAVFQVRSVGGRTEVQGVKSPSERFEICRTLGYHASDLLQTNAVIWVEGPSDRIYLLEWLRQVAPELKEGYQFSVMFYGGRLLSNLTAAEEEVDDFIQLRRLNRNFAVIMDSDKTSARAKVHATKERIVRELANGGGVAWISTARTVESYVPLDAWKVAVAKVHPTAKPNWDGMPFSDPFEGLPESRDKIRIAKELVSAGQLRVDVHDLPGKLEVLVTMIRQANPPVVVSAQS